MKTITFLNNKGGVGKTASVTTIAHMLAAEFHQKVLLIDLDPQMNTTCMFGDIDFIELFFAIYKGKDNVYQKEGQKQKSVENLLLDKDLDIHECICHTEYENLDFIPSYLTLSAAEDRIKSDVTTPQQFRLKKHLAALQDEYDYCIIDSSPSLSVTNINGLVSADEVYIPLRCDGGSLLGVAIIMNTFEAVIEYNPNIKIGGMFFTQWDGRKNVSKTVYELLEQIFGEHILPVTISTSKNIEECSLMQKPLLEYDNGKNKCRATRDYMKLTEYIHAGVICDTLGKRGQYGEI